MNGCNILNPRDHFKIHNLRHQKQQFFIMSIWHFARSTDPQKIPAAAHQISTSAAQQAAQIRAAGPDQRSSCKTAHQIQRSAQPISLKHVFFDSLKTAFFLNFGKSQNALRGETQSGAAPNGPGRPKSGLQLHTLKAKKKPLFLAAFFCFWLALFDRIYIEPDTKADN